MFNLRGKIIMTALLMACSTAGCAVQRNVVHVDQIGAFDSEEFAKITVVNDSIYSYTELYFSPSDDGGGWGPDLLGGTLYVGETFELTGIRTGRWSIKCATEDYSIWLNGIEIQAGNSYQIELAAAD